LPEPLDRRDTSRGLQGDTAAIRSLTAQRVPKSRLAQTDRLFLDVRQDEDMLITIDTGKTLPKVSAVTPLQYVE
jgi:hypothetical protein